MRKSFAVTLFLLACRLTAASAAGRPGWQVGEKYLLLDKKPVFLSGVNYVPSRNWHLVLDQWDEPAVDSDLAALKALGIGCIRFFPLWNLTQPEPGRIDEEVFRRIGRILDLAGKHGLFVQIAPLTGWMSGGTFLPDWAAGNIFTDPAIVDGEKFLAGQIAARFGSHAALQGYDFGNEINVLLDVMRLEAGIPEIAVWMRAIYESFRSADPAHPVTNGIGTGFNRLFNIQAIADASDYLSVHSYPYWHSTSRLDPPLGQRTTYSSNYIVSWAEMAGKPVLLQEIGATDAKTDPVAMSRFLRVTYFSNWAEGAAGYFWWCSHDVDPDFRVYTPGSRPEYSNSHLKNRVLGEFEEGLGLLDIRNREKEHAAGFRECIRKVEKLGFGWKDALPACFILIPENSDYHETMIRMITPFALAKRCHADVKLWPEGRDIPSDADFLVIPGFSLSERGREKVLAYLEAGGTVYQSFENDFAREIRLLDQQTFMDKPLFHVEWRRGRMEADRYLRLPAMTVRRVQAQPSVKVLARIHKGDESLFDYEAGDGVFFETRIGKGRYFFLAGNPEAGLERVFDPWPSDDTHLIYSAMRPEPEIDIDNPDVELYHKKRGGEELLLLINHSESFEDVLIRCRGTIRLKAVWAGGEIKGGPEIPLCMPPAEVLGFFVRR
ncbi:cellulase family glycosylhydrolase [bacterium]|nr:cellulase family glycosylhydrolase [bacterium]